MTTAPQFDGKYMFVPSHLEQRSLPDYARRPLRNAIVSHPRWKEFSTENNCSVSNMAKRGFFAVAYSFGIDVGKILDTAEKFNASVAVQKADDERENDESNRWLAEQGCNASNSGRGEAAPETVAPPAPAPVPNELGAMLAALVGPYLNTVSTDMEERLKRSLLTALAQKLESLTQVTRIEVKRQDGTEYKTTGRQHKNFALLLKMLGAKQANKRPVHVWMTGPTGSGKTHSARAAAIALGLAFNFQGAALQAHELLGFKSPVDGQYYTTAFREAFEKGGVFLADEIDSWSNEALLCLNAALANGHCNFPDGAIEAHPDFVCIGAGNTWGNGATAQFIGRTKIDLAVLSRFVKIHWPSDDALEIDICGNVEWAKHVQKVRAKVTSGGKKDINIDTRTSMHGAALLAAGLTWGETCEATYLAGASDEVRRDLSNI